MTRRVERFRAMTCQPRDLTGWIEDECIRAKASVRARHFSPLRRQVEQFTSVLRELPIAIVEVDLIVGSQDG